MEEIELQPRLKSDGSTNSLLKNNKIPCVVYGKNTDTHSVVADFKILNTLIKNASFYSKILSVKINGKKEKVLPKEVQFHPVTDSVIHIDFLRVQDTTKVTVDVPVTFLNREVCPGIKQGGVLNTVRRTVELICNVSQIPEKIEFDLINSDIGDSVKISNINLPESVKPKISDRDFVIATLVPPTVEAEPEPTAEEDKEGTEGEVKAEDAEGKKESTTESTTESKKEESTEKKPENKDNSK